MVPVLCDIVLRLFGRHACVCVRCKWKTASQCNARMCGMHGSDGICHVCYDGIKCWLFFEIVVVFVVKWKNICERLTLAHAPHTKSYLCYQILNIQANHSLESDSPANAYTFQLQHTTVQVAFNSHPNERSARARSDVHKMHSSIACKQR